MNKLLSVFTERELGAAFSFLEFIQSRIPTGGGNDTSHWCLKGMAGLIPNPITISLGV